MLNYTDFLIETYDVQHNAKSKEAFLMACAVKGGASLDESESLQFFISEGFIDSLFETCLSINEESFADKFKALAAAAQEKIKEKGKEYADKLGAKSQAALKFGGKIMGPLKSVLGKIKEILIKAWNMAKDAARASVEKAKEKIKEKIQPYLKDTDKRKKVVEEAKNLSAMGGAVAKWATGDLIGELAKGGQKAATTEESFDYMSAFESAFYYAAAETLNEGYTIDEILIECELFESGHGESKGGLQIPFISSIMSKLSHMPPFSVFHKIEGKVADAAETGLERMSILATKIASAPGPFKFPVMAGLIGIAAGYLAESTFKQSLIDLHSLAEKGLGFAIPGFGIAIKFMKYGGLALAVYGVINELVGGEAKDDKKEEEPKEEPKTDKDEKTN
jgi:hypothetical protein